MFSGVKITVGIAGGISAYKAADVVSWLNNNGADVQVVMTEGATKFITPLTMKALSKRPVAVDIMSEDSSFHIPHIDCAECDLLVIIAATANFMAKAAYGLADDLLTATVLATTAPIVCAPAMNTNMYENAATQNNIALLKERGWSFIEPGYGLLACGVVGQGRLATLDVIKDALSAKLGKTQVLAGKKVLITSGPTYEYIDPVRFIGNRSSGKMGWHIAEAAKNAGAEVTLVLGPSALSDISGVNTIRVTSAQQMYDAVWACYDECDIVVAAAAVADYRPQTQAAEKIKKSGDESLQLVRNPDILASLGAQKQGRFLVGFAAETQNMQEYAKKKLHEKNLDLIIVNNVAQAGAGFDVDTNIVTAIWPEGENVALDEWPLMSKKAVAAKIIDKIVDLQQ